MPCSFDGWKSLAWKTASYFPGITLFTLTSLNILIHHTGSSGAIPLGAFFSLIALWFIISIPLCFSGAPAAAPKCCHRVRAGGAWRSCAPQLTARLQGPCMGVQAIMLDKADAELRGSLAIQCATMLMQASTHANPGLPSGLFSPSPASVPEPSSMPAMPDPAP